MSLPEGWEWLDEIPPEWSPPAELKSPSKNPSTNLAIQMLSSDSLDNDLVDLVGQFISEKARFNLWFLLEAKKKASSLKELALLGLVYNHQSRAVYEVWTDFIDAYRANDKLAGTFDAEKASLKAALGEAVSKLHETRGYFRACLTWLVAGQR
ncbi:MAG: hypothetical protein ACRDT8_22450 [Micromonosporaceae bacterium]